MLVFRTEGTPCHNSVYNIPLQLSSEADGAQRYNEAGRTIVMNGVFLVFRQVQRLMILPELKYRHEGGLSKEVLIIVGHISRSLKLSEGAYS